MALLHTWISARKHESTATVARGKNQDQIIVTSTCAACPLLSPPAPSGLSCQRAQQHPATRGQGQHR
jgi:hypothetical protein